MKAFQILVLSLLVIGFSGCGSSRYNEEIKELDQLIAQVEKASTRLVKIDTTGLEQKWTEYKNNVTSITDSYKTTNDTMSGDIAMLLSEYKELKKPYSEFKEAYEEAFEELKFTKNQLLNLKHDLQNDILEPPVASKMVKSEEMAARKIIGQVEQLARADSVTEMKAPGITAKIDSVISALSQTQ